MAKALARQAHAHQDHPSKAPQARAETADRASARARAASLLGLPPSGIEEDLIDFLVACSGDALLRARAGSGKTTALTIKAAHLVLDRGVDPASIMLLTFNNAAARTLESRLAAVGLPVGGDEGIRVRTFHALGQRIVRAHFGASRRAVFDETSEDGRAIAAMMQEAVDEVLNEKFYFFCAGRMRTHYGKRREYVESVGRDALISAVNFMRARGFGLANRMEGAWERGPIAGNAMKAVLGYEVRLKRSGLLDATSVLQAAAWTLEREIETCAMRPSDAHGVVWIFIDEFQDVSLPYMRLVAAVRALNGGAVVQGVGDDWQAINGFAGADLDYFVNVGQHLDDPVELDLLRNRRSGSVIVNWGNRVMANAGFPDAPAIASPERGEGVLNRARVLGNSDWRFAASRLADLVDPAMADVALIARRWKAGDYPLPQLRGLVEASLRDRGWKGKVTAITAHGSKGLEYDQVLLLDDGSFPLEHPARPIMEALIPIEDYLREESCLKYVAGTRARKRLDIVDMS